MPAPTYVMHVAKNARGIRWTIASNAQKPAVVAQRNAGAWLPVHQARWRDGAPGLLRIRPALLASVFSPEGGSAARRRMQRRHGGQRRRPAWLVRAAPIGLLRLLVSNLSSLALLPSARQYGISEPAPARRPHAGRDCNQGHHHHLRSHALQRTCRPCRGRNTGCATADLCRSFLSPADTDSRSFVRKVLSRLAADERSFPRDAGPPAHGSRR